MDFTLTDEQRQIREMVAEFGAERLAPHSRHWDESCEFPVDVLRELATLGLAGIYVSPQYGGSGMGRLEAAIVFEELARGDVSLAAFLSIHNMVTWMVDSFGSDAQRAEWLPALTSMDKIASYCLTEPECGSDASALRTTAHTDDNEHYVPRGSKAFISGAGCSDVYAVMCRTGGEGAGGISCILVPNGTEGLSFGAQDKKMGWRSQPTAMISLDSARVPASNRIGREGEGFQYAMAGLDVGRVNISACSVGGAAWALEAARVYALERKAFGKPIAENQAIAFKLAEMATGLEASRLLVRRAAAALDAGEPGATGKAAMAKMFATETCWWIVDDALQVHGGYGYIRDFGLEQRLRDLRVHRILEGTSEIMRLVAARYVLAEN